MMATLCKRLAWLALPVWLLLAGSAHADTPIALYKSFAGNVNFAGTQKSMRTAANGSPSGACAITTGHLTIGRGSVLAARATATKSFPPGSRIAGFPAVDAGAWKREVATIRRLSKRTESGR